MKHPGNSKRHYLLPQIQTMKRLFRLTLILGLLLGFLWWYSRRFNSGLPLAGPPGALLAAAVLSLAFAGLAFPARKLYYVKTFPDHLRLVTPFLKLKISYRRILSSLPVDIKRYVQSSDVKKTDRKALKTYFGKTALIVKLNGFPLSPLVLRFFLPGTMFLPGDQGMLLIVKDWMGLSTELDSVSESWRARKHL